MKERRIGKKLAVLKTEIRTDAFREKVDAIVQQNQTAQPTDAAITAMYKNMWQHLMKQNAMQRFAAVWKKRIVR